MKKFAAALVVLAAAFVLGACAHGPGHRCANCPAGGPGSVHKAAQSPAVVYWCNCGPECKCNSVSTKPGKCSCGKEMAGGHVVFTEGNTALACTCGPGCSCAIDPNDHSKCGCGKPIKRLDLTGTGLYFCNCGGSCGCNTVSDKPGTCKCGMPLHQAK
jgi:hypothetical protein